MGQRQKIRKRVFVEGRNRTRVRIDNYGKKIKNTYKNKTSKTIKMGNIEEIIKLRCDTLLIAIPVSLKV